MSAARCQERLDVITGSSLLNRPPKGISTMLSFLPGGKVQVVLQKRGAGTGLFTSAKWQRRCVTVEPAAKQLTYADNPGEPAKGTMDLTNAQITVVPDSRAPRACRVGLIFMWFLQ